MAFGQSQRIRTSPAGFCEKRTRSRIRDDGQPQCTDFKGCEPRQNIQQFSVLTHWFPHSLDIPDLKEARCIIERVGRDRYCRQQLGGCGALRQIRTAMRLCPLLARPGQGQRSARTVGSGLRLVHGGLRHARSEGREGAVGGVGVVSSLNRNGFGSSMPLCRLKKHARAKHFSVCWHTLLWPPSQRCKCRSNSGEQG